MRFSRLSPILLAALLLAACDSGLESVDPPTDTVSAEVAAAAVGQALSIDGGGVLDDVIGAAESAYTDEAASASDADGPRMRHGCTGERSYDDAIGVWTASIQCERGNPEGRFYARYGRQATFAFFDAAGSSVARPRNASSLDFDIVRAEGYRRSPRLEHELLGLDADLALTGLGDGDGLVTANGTYDRSATDTLQTREGEFALTYALGLTLNDVTGPRGRRDRWHTVVSGSIDGTLRATLLTPDGERSINETFTITFTEDGATTDASREARFILRGRHFRANVRSGETREVSP